MPLTHLPPTMPPMPGQPPARDPRRERRILGIEVAAILILALSVFLIAASGGWYLLGAGCALLVIGLGALMFAIAAQVE